MDRPILDITRPLGVATPAWPGDAPLAIGWTSDPGADAAVSRVTLSPHLGTHVDAPLHLVPGGSDAASIALAACLGPCHVLDLRGRPGAAAASGFAPGWRPRHARVLLATDAWPAGAELPAAFPGVPAALVDRLADSGVRLIGVDTPSIDCPDSGDLPAHRRCVARGVVILEGLDLTGVAAGEYTLVALPLRLVGVEASPVRAVLLPPEVGVGHPSAGRRG